VVLLQPVEVSVNVNVALPFDTPVTTPALVTVAMVLSLLTHVPPEEGLKVNVAPTQSVGEGVLTTGAAFTVTDEVVLLQPVAVSVKVNVTLPIDTPVTNPALVTVAMVLSLLTQVPPVVGLRIKVDPAQSVGEGVLTTGNALTVTDEVVLLQPVTVSVKVNVTLPIDTPVTKPALVTVAIVLSLLTQVPPVVGLKVKVDPIQSVGDGVLTTGKAFTVTGDVVLLQPVAVSVKVNVTLPAAAPVTNPALVTVAIVLSLLAQVPPVVGLKVKVDPAQSVGEGVLTIGNALTVTDEVVLLQPVAVSVKVNVTAPIDIPVTRPAFVTVAMVLSLLTQVPPEEGLKVKVAPMQSVGDGVVTTGCCMSTVAELLLQPVTASVKVKMTLPTEMPVTSPAPVTVATAGLSLTQVPPEFGNRFIVAPTQRLDNGIVIIGNALMVIDGVVLLQPVAVSVKVNVTVPAVTPVTTPAFVTVAIVLSLLIHVPPTAGLKFMVAPTQIAVDGALTTGCCTVTGLVVLLQVVVPSVKVNVIVPVDMPVTTPALVTVATALLLLTHVPPEDGLRFMVAPTHNVADGALTVGNGLTVTTAFPVMIATQSVAAL
jgi:hypothetical protein